MKDKYILTVDPGVSIGWALWKPGTKLPLRTGIAPATVSREGSYQTRSLAAVSYLQHALTYDWRCIGLVWIEWPQFFGFNATAARGDLVKLAFSVGCLARMIDAFGGIRIHFVKVHEWKGQLSKATIQRRIRKILGDGVCKEFKDDIWDAVGIGLWTRNLL